jgi:branched-chain amino acid transport system ATP-binding protein
VLAAEHITVSFGGVRAVSDVSLEVPDGKVVGLVGPNGSGKSTFLNAICGLVTAKGAVSWDGAPLRLNDPIAVRRSGILRTFQTPQVIPTLTCLENVVLADADRTATGLLSAILLRRRTHNADTARWRRAGAALQRVGLGGTANLRAAQLTYGQRRLLELARAVSAAGRLLLLDEPTAGLNEEETALFADLLLGLQAEGISLLVVDHKVDFLDRLCNHIVVLELGQVIAEGSPTQVWADERVIGAYLGVDPDETDDAFG